MTMPSTTAKPYEVKREEFRKYLEHAGVMDSLTNVLISLYQENERPDDALEYFRKYFAATSDINKDSASEIEALKKDLAEARLYISELNEKLQKYESENAA